MSLQGEETALRTSYATNSVRSLGDDVLSETFTELKENCVAFRSGTGHTYLYEGEETARLPRNSNFAWPPPRKRKRKRDSDKNMGDVPSSIQITTLTSQGNLFLRGFPQTESKIERMFVIWPLLSPERTPISAALYFSLNLILLRVGWV